MREIIENLIKQSTNRLSIKYISDVTGISRSSVKRVLDQIRYEPVRHQAWNKGKTLSKVKRSKRGKLDPVIRYKISQTMKQNPFAGGHRKGSGRGEKHEYRNTLLNSDYSLAVARILDREGIKWEKPDQLFHYIDQDGNSKEGGLDFYLPQYDCYLAVKEFMTNGIRYNHKSMSLVSNIKVVLIDGFLSKRLKYSSFKLFLETVLKR